jgi:hypothetical protein
LMKSPGFLRAPMLRSEVLRTDGFQHIIMCPACIHGISTSLLSIHFSFPLPALELKAPALNVKTIACRH